MKHTIYSFLAISIVCLTFVNAQWVYGETKSSWFDSIKQTYIETKIKAKKAIGEDDIEDYKAQFGGALEIYDAQKSDVGEEFNLGVKGLQAAIDVALTKDGKFRSVYTDWKRISGEIESLNEDFIILVKAAKSLFDALERNANSISNIDMRNEALSDIQGARNRYRKHIEKTENEIGKLNEKKVAVVDIIKLLEVKATIQVLEDTTNDLEQINAAVQRIMAELDVLSKESQALLQVKRAGD